MKSKIITTLCIASVSTFFSHARSIAYTPQPVHYAETSAQVDVTPKTKRQVILEISGYDSWGEFKKAPKAEKKAAREAYRESSHYKNRQEKRQEKQAKRQNKRNALLEISGYDSWDEFKKAPKAEKKAARKAYSEALEAGQPIELTPESEAPKATTTDIDGDGYQDDFVIPMAHYVDTDGDGIYDKAISGRDIENENEQEIAGSADLDRDGQADDFFIPCVNYVDSDKNGVYDSITPLYADLDGDCIEDDFVVGGEYIDTNGDGTYDAVIGERSPVEFPLPGSEDDFIIAPEGE